MFEKGYLFLNFRWKSLKVIDYYHFFGFRLSRVWSLADVLHLLRETTSHLGVVVKVNSDYTVAQLVPQTIL